MIGACLRAGVTCPRCDTTVPLNALVPSVRCHACGETLQIEHDDWESILGRLPEEAPGMEEGEGSRSRILGNHDFVVTRGRLAPRYGGTSRPVDPALLRDGVEKGSLRHPESGEPTSVRPVPGEYEDLLPGVVALLGEDPGLLAADSSESDLQVDQGASRPVAFGCPSCGGYLVAEARDRMAVCSHCGEKAAIPERLWERIHPPRKMRMWFLLLEAVEAGPSWGGDAYAAAPDGQGGAVLAVADGEGPPMLLALDGSGTVRWSRRFFEEAPSEPGNPRLAPLPGGGVIAWRQDRPDMHVLSPADGRGLRTVEGHEPESASDWGRFTMLGCVGLAAFEDSVVLCSGPWRDGEGRKQYRLLRFSLRGEPMDLWKPGKRPGFLSRLFGRRSRLDCFAKCGNRPEALRDGVLLAGGSDGSMFMLQRNLLAKFDASGEKLFFVDLPDGYSEGDPVVDASGRCWVLIHGAEHETALVCVSPDGGNVIEAASTDDSDHPLYFASAAAPVRDGILAAGWNGGLYLHEAPDTVS